MNGIQLSVVIASHNAQAPLALCLKALARQTAPAVEVILCDCSTDATASMVQRDFPAIRLLHFDQPLSLARLRGHGIAAATGSVIAILDPYSIPSGDWAAQVIEAHAQRSDGVIGGAVDLYQADSASWSRWTTYFNEYGLFMSPVRRGAMWILPGCNVSYKRAMLFDAGRPRYPVFWKTFANWDAESAGHSLWLEPAIRIELFKPVSYSDFLRTRLVHGRCFAGMRVADASKPERLFRAASTVLVPFLQLWRWTSAFWSKRRHRARFVATLPLQFLLFVMWSLGESIGYLRGTGGACERTYY